MRMNDYNPDDEASEMPERDPEKEQEEEDEEEPDVTA